MAIRAKDIYQGRKKSHSRAGIIITIVLVVLVAVVLIFYGLRNYAVYDENGNATLVLPFTHKQQTESPAPSAQMSPNASPSTSPAESVSPSPPESTGAGTTPSAPVG